MSHMKNRDGNRQRREDRQVQAGIRNEAYGKLSVAEKLARLDAGHFVATRQRARLAKQAPATAPNAAEAAVGTPEAPKRARKARKAS